MAHRTTQKRILVPPPDPKPATITQNPDQKTPCKLLNMSKNSSKSNPTYKIHRSQKPNTPNPPPPSIDTHSQAKSMTVSAIFDSSKYSLSKSNPQKTEEKYSKRASKEVGKKKNYREPIGEEKKEVGVVKEKELKGVFEGYDIVRMPASASLGGGRRRSFGGEKFELGDFLAGNGVKIVSVDMPPFMQIHAVDCARKAFDSLENFTSKTLALTLKKEFDGVYGPAWHCIVGTSFGSFVTHSVGGFLYFSMDQKLYILLFKTTVQRAD